MKVTTKEYLDFINHEANMSANLSLGQKFCKYFNIVDTELYNTKSKNDAFKIIFTEYLKEDIIH